MTVSLHPRSPARAPRGSRLPSRVLFVTPRFWPEIGGVETHCLQVGRRLVAAGVPVTLATTDLSETLPRREDVEGIDVRRFPAIPRSKDFYVSPALARFVRAHPWPLVHVQGYHTALAPMAMLAALTGSRPYVINLHSGGHSSRLRNALRPAQGIALRPLLTRAERVIAGSDFEASTFIHRVRLDPRRVVVIPSGTDLAAGEASPDRKPPVPGLIVAPGRLERYKGHHRVIDAMPQVIEARSDARLRVLGEGPEGGVLRARAAQLGVGDRVEIGSVSGESAVADAIAAASVVVSLSDYESQGLAVLEAISLGVPVVATRASAFTELAERGLITPVAGEATTSEIAAALIAALPADGSVERATSSAPLLATWDDSTNALIGLYSDISAGSVGTPS